MQQYSVDDDLAALVESLAKKKPFENLSFNDALRRVLHSHASPIARDKKDGNPGGQLGESMSTLRREAKKAPSPSPTEWAATIPELKGKKGLNTWKAVCVLLKIETAGDSARRRLKNWVRTKRPEWPPVPDVE